jgi:WD40 repeat protein
VLSNEPVPVTQLNPKVPRDLETICLKCLHKEPGRRYATAQALAEDLRHFLANEPIAARPVSRTERVIKWANRRPALAGLLATLFLVLVLGGSLLVVGYGHLASERQRQRAEAAEAEAKRQLERAEGLVYAGQLAQAQTAWLEGDVLAAREFLNACRPELRGWEHDHLRQRFDETQATLRGHSQMVTCVCFSPDGKHLASGSHDNTVKLWDAATGLEVVPLQGHTRDVSCVCFSPDSKLLATGSRDRTVKLWDVASGKEIRFFKDTPGEIRSVCFSPDGKRLVGGSYRTVGSWDTATGQNLPAFQGHTGLVNSVCFSPDGKRLASGGGEFNFHSGELILWDVAAAKNTHAFKRQRSWIQSVCYSPDGKHLASGCQDGTVHLCDAPTGMEIRSFVAHRHEVLSVCFSPDGKHLASASKDKTVKLWDAATGQELLSLKGHTDWVCSVCFSPDGGRLASASKDNTVKLWDAATGQQLPSFRRLTEYVANVCFSPDGKRLASGTTDKTLKVWDVEKRLEILQLRGYTEHVSTVVFSPDGTRLVTAGGTHRLDQKLKPLPGEIKLWDAATGKELAFFKGPGGWVRSVSFSPDGTRLASGSGDGTVRLWDAMTGKVVHSLEGHTFVSSVAFSSDGKRLASGGGNILGELMLWDTAMDRPPRVLKGHSQRVNSVCFSPDGTRLVSGGWDRTLRIWETRTGKELFCLKGHQDHINCVCFSPDGKRLASGSGELTALGELKIWDAATGQELLALKGHTGPVESVCFSPDGSRLASGSADQTVRFWETATGKDQKSSDLALLARLNDVPARLRWHRREAAASEAIQQWFAAAFHLRQLLLAHEGDAPQGEPNDHGVWHRAVVLHAHLGNKEGYGRLCRAMLQRFGDTADPAIAERSAKACLLLADVNVEPQKVVQLADLAVTKQPEHPSMAWFCLAKGLTAYRLGRPAEAGEWLQKSLAKKPAPYAEAMARFVLTMTHQQRGQADEAKLTLVRAQQITSELPPLEKAGASWPDWMINDLLRREAETIIAARKTDAAK